MCAFSSGCVFFSLLNLAAWRFAATYPTLPLCASVLCAYMPLGEVCLGAVEEEFSPYRARVEKKACISIPRAPDGEMQKTQTVGPPLLKHRDSKGFLASSPSGRETAPKQRPPKTRDDADPCDSAPSKAPPQNHLRCRVGSEGPCEPHRAPSSSILLNRLAFGRVLPFVPKPSRASFKQGNSSSRSHASLSSLLPRGIQGGGSFGALYICSALLFNSAVF